MHLFLVTLSQPKPKCCSIKADLEQISFEKLDFGDTTTWDKFYNADVAIVDMSIEYQQFSLSYHIGVRESMSMPETAILIHDTNPEFTLSVNVSDVMGNRGVHGSYNFNQHIFQILIFNLFSS